MHLVLRETVHPARARLERQHQAALQMVLGALELLGRDPVLLELTDLLEGGLQHLREVGGIAGRVEIEHARVEERLHAGVDRVHEPLALAHLLEETRRHAAADDLVEQEQRVPPGIGLPEPRKPHHDILLIC